MPDQAKTTRSPFKAGFLIHDASRLRRTVFDQRLKTLGVTRSQWWVLINLDRSRNPDGFTQIELARLLDVGKVTLGGLIDRLESNGLVRRVPDQHDRRSKRVQASNKGRALLKKIESVAVEVNRETMLGISESEENALIDILTRMKRNLKAMDAVPSASRES